MKLKQINYYIISNIVLFTGVLPTSAQTYEISWDREVWEEELQELPIVREDFSIPYRQSINKFKCTAQTQN